MIYFYLSLSLLGGPLIVMPMPGVDRLNHALYDQPMVLILDGNSEHVVYKLRLKKYFLKKKSDL